jgi:hypothetical protein
MATVSGRSFNVEETQRYAATIMDPARMVQAYAGVAMGGDDLRNEIVVRGNSPRGILWRIEGIECINPNHFVNIGNPGGAVSMLSAATLSSSDFFTGAFPAEYGNALSGVFDLNFRNGNNQRRESSVMVGVLGTEVASEGPFSRNYTGSYIFTYRYSTLKLLDMAGISVSGDQVPSYQDLTFKVFLPTRKLGTFSLFGIGGYSHYTVPAVADTARWAQGESSDEDNESITTGSVGVAHTLSLGERTYLKTVVAGSYNLYDYDSYSLIATQNYAKRLDFTEYYSRSTYRASLLMNHKFSAKSKIRAGLIAAQIDFDYRFDLRRDSLGPLETFFNARGGYQLLQGYVQWQYRFTPKLTLNTGLHGMYLTMNGTYSIEPRAGLRWQALHNHSFGFGVGLHSRVDEFTTYYGKDSLGNQPNRNLELPKALHAVASYSFRFSHNWRLALEAYYQHLFHLPVYNSVAQPWLPWNNRNIYEEITNAPQLVSKGIGRNYGLDFTLERFLANNWYGMVTASAFQSQYQGLNHEWYNTRYNYGYVTNLLAGKEFIVGKRKRNLIGLNVRALVMGGQWQNRVDVGTTRALYAQNPRVYQIAYTRTPMEEQLPTYYRFDAGVSFTLNGRKVTHLLSLNIQNFTNRLNLFSRVYDPAKDKFVDVYQTGLVPIINYKVQF